jgi:hypothetical protein
MNCGIPDTMRAAFWTILSGAEVSIYNRFRVLTAHADGAGV